MARVRVEEIVNYLERDIRKALAYAVQRELPDADFSERSLLRSFKRGIRRKCSTWERVPDQYVDCS